MEIHFVSILMLNLTNLPCILTFITDFHTCPFVIVTIVKVFYTAKVFSSLCFEDCHGNHNSVNNSNENHGCLGVASVHIVVCDLFL